MNALALLALMATLHASPLTDIHGVRLGMAKADVHTTLAAGATLQREERRRHEIWTLTGDPRFASLIVGYTKEWNVRFVTAVAKPGGKAVGYAEVLDLTAATHRAAGQTHTYTWVTGTPPYSIIAIGPPSRLEYLSIEDGQ